MSRRSSPVLGSDFHGYVAARIGFLRAIIEGTSSRLLGVSSLRALFPTIDNRHPSRKLCQSQFSIDQQIEATLDSSFRLVKMVVNDNIAVWSISLEMRRPRGTFRRASQDGLCGTVLCWSRSLSGPRGTGFDCRPAMREIRDCVVCVIGLGWIHSSGVWGKSLVEGHKLLTTRRFTGAQGENVKGAT